MLRRSDVFGFVKGDVFWLAGRRLARMCIYPSLSMSICSCYILLHTMTVMCHESILEPLGQHAFSGFGLVGSLI